MNKVKKISLLALLFPLFLSCNQKKSAQGTLIICSKDSVPYTFANVLLIQKGSNDTGVYNTGVGAINYELKIDKPTKYILNAKPGKRDEILKEYKTEEGDYFEEFSKEILINPDKKGLEIICSK